MNFLVDAQLPPLLANWINEHTQNNARPLGSLEEGLTQSDSKIWEIALINNEIIVTKDSDFFNRVMASDTAPGVWHLAIGNCSNKRLIACISE